MNNEIIETAQMRGLVSESKRAIDRWLLMRWIYLGFGLLFAIIAYTENALDKEYLYVPSHVFAGFSGGIFGFLIKNWNGSKELKLLRRFSDTIEQSNETA